MTKNEKAPAALPLAAGAVRAAGFWYDRHRSAKTRYVRVEDDERYVLATDGGRG